MQLIVLFLLCDCLLARRVDYCYINEDDPYLYFGTKTPYRFVTSGSIRRHTIPDCKPIQIWMLMRHGTRYPQKAAIERLLELPKIRNQIIDNHQSRKEGHLCDEDLENLRIWSPHRNMTLQHARRLSTEGWREAKLLARRLKFVFPELLQPSPEDITFQNYVFRTTRTSRGASSMVAFIEGLFGGKPRVNAATLRKRDPLLQSVDNCPRWSEGEDEVYMERDKFIDGPEYAQLIDRVSQRLGFRYNITSAAIHNMQDMCRFEMAWVSNQPSPWCAMFSKQDLQVLEYIDDLQYYHGCGYGREVNKLIGCFPVQDMFRHFREIESGNTSGKPKGTFYFGQSKVFLSFLHSMKIAEDSQHLLASNFQDMASRKWRTSLIAPFSSNFIATFYRCKDTESPNKVTFRLEEQLIMYEGCKDGICDWDYLKMKLGKIANSCSIENCLDKAQYDINFVLLIFLLFMVGFSLRRAISTLLRKVLQLFSINTTAKKKYGKLIVH